MAIVRRINQISQMRVEITDMRSLESAVSADFDAVAESFISGITTPYVIRGFEIVTTGAIGGAASGLQMIVSNSALLHTQASQSGTFYLVPSGTANQILNSANNTQVTGAFTPNAINYVGIDYTRIADPTTNVTRYLWDVTSSTETTTIAPSAITLNYQIIITSSVWAPTTIPIAIVNTDSNNNVISLTDCRNMLFRLGTGGASPNPFNQFDWTQGRTETLPTSSSNAVNCFEGGDKAIQSLKDWMNAIMSIIQEIKGTLYWYSSASSGGGSLPSIQTLFQDLGNTIITGSGQISNGILPNSDPLLVTTGTIASGSNQLTSLASVSGISNGDFIFGTGIPQNTTVISISGSTVTMSQDATINGSGIGITFYAPGVITSPGQINWDQPIQIRVIGSALTYELTANASSNDITLSDDEVAYVTLIRDVAISPNLIFVGGSPNVSSVGGVAWTSNLIPGDYIKLASDTVSGYYQIQTVNSSSTVTLTTNVQNGDNTGAGGAKALYAFGSYSAAASPSTNRNIYISSRENVPAGGNVFWLFAREDNGGAPRVYVRFLSQEIDSGQSVEVSGSTSQQLLQYVGAPTAASAFPQYVDAVAPGSVPEITTITVGAGSTMTGGQYFTINSSGNYRKYVFWFQVSGAGSAPTIPYTTQTIEVPVLASDTAANIATKLAAALKSTPSNDFSAVAGTSTVTVTNNSAGATTAAANGNVSSPFAITIAQAGTGQGNYGIQDGQNLTLAIKELDGVIGAFVQLLDSPEYSEAVSIVASGATPPGSLNGPVAVGTNITLPNNSRINNSPQYYSVGAGTLKVFLNGQLLLLGTQYTEVGTAGAASNQIQINTYQGLQVGDELEFRIDIGGGGGGLPGPQGPVGPAGPAGMNSAGGPVAISTKVSSYTVLTTDCFLAANCASNPITFTLPPAASNSGRIFYFKLINATNAMTIVPQGGDAIDGNSSLVISMLNDSVSLISNGSNGWYAF